MEEAQKKAQELFTKIQKGSPAFDLAKEFVACGSSIPDGLVVASLGQRVQQIPGQVDVLRLLLEAKGNPNAEDQLGPSKLAVIHSACYHSSVEIVSCLLEFRADLNTLDPSMKTPPLNTALAAGNAPVCLHLLNQNADVSWSHQDGATPLHVATAWIASAHNSHLRMPPLGDEPLAVVSMMMHNGVDPTQTEGMSKGSVRVKGMTPLEAFRQDVARSPWRTDEAIGPKFDKQAKKLYTLLEQGEEATKYKQTGNKHFTDAKKIKQDQGDNARFRAKCDDALKAWREARSAWETANIRGHHMAVLWNNEALLKRTLLNDIEGSKAACKEGLTHYCSKAIREKLEYNLNECIKPPPEPTEEQKVEAIRKEEVRKEKQVKYKEEVKEVSKKVVQSDGGIYGEEASAQKDYKVPGPFICPMDDAQNMGLGPPPAPKPWWEKKEEDSDEEPPRTTIGYLPAHHPNW